MKMVVLVMLNLLVAGSLFGQDAGKHDYKYDKLGKRFVAANLNMADVSFVLQDVLICEDAKVSISKRLKSCKKAIKKVEAKKNMTPSLEFVLNETYSNIGILSEKQENIKQAKEYYQKAIDGGYCTVNRECNAVLNLSKLAYNNDGDYQKVYLLLKQVLKYSENEKVRKVANNNLDIVCRNHSWVCK